ncbi:MAG: hypothetical protein ACP5HC_01970, partial [Caldisericum sp.]
MENLKHEFIEKFKEAIAFLKKNGIHIGRYILVSSVLSLTPTIFAKLAISSNDLIGVGSSFLIYLINDILNFIKKTSLEKINKSNSGDFEKLKSSIDELSEKLKGASQVNTELIEELSKNIELIEVLSKKLGLIEELSKNIELIEVLSKSLEDASKDNIKYDEIINGVVQKLIDSEVFKEILKEQGINLDDLNKEISESIKTIKEDLEILKKANLPRIENVLEKDESTEPKFFRPAGPLWIDFEKGYVYENPQVDEIIDKLKKEKIVIIKGKPASGKSVILKNIGYKLANEGAEVYFIGLKNFVRESISEIPKISHGYLIIDDAHLDLKIIDNILLIRPKTKILIATRDINIDKTEGPTSELKFAEYIKNAITIEPQDSANGIIGKFEEKKFQIPDNIKANLAKNNLWVLAWQLKSYESSRKIDEETVLKIVKEYIENLIKEKESEVQNVLYPLAILYRYEIPMRETFLKYLYESYDKIIPGLEKLGEIVRFTDNDRNYIALHHSETADIYFKAFNKYVDLASDIKGKIDEEYETLFSKSDNSTVDIELKLFSIYLRKFNDETTNVLSRISKYELMSKIIKINFDDIIKGLKREKNLEKIAMSLKSVAKTVDFQTANEILEKIDVDDLIEKFKREEDIWKIKWFFIDISNVDKDLAKKILEKIDVDDLREKVKREEDIWNIGDFFDGISNVDKDLAKKILEKIDVDDLIEKVEREEDIGKIELFFYDISNVDKDLAKKILEKIDVDDLREKVKRNKSIWNIK